MLNRSRYTGPAWLALGLGVGLVVGGLLPHAPLHAVATDRMDSFSIATGAVDEEVEAVYFLDALNGTLNAAVVANQMPARFQAKYTADLRIGLAAAVAKLRSAGRSVQMPAAPTFMMVTGFADLRGRGAARSRPSLSMVYVAETNTGIVMAYYVPWNQGAHAANVDDKNALVLWAAEQFIDTSVIRSP